MRLKIMVFVFISFIAYFYVDASQNNTNELLVALDNQQWQSSNPEVNNLFNQCHQRLLEFDSLYTLQIELPRLKNEIDALVRRAGDLWVENIFLRQGCQEILREYRRAEDEQIKAFYNMRVQLAELQKNNNTLSSDKTALEAVLTAKKQELDLMKKTSDQHSKSMEAAYFSTLFRYKIGICLLLIIIGILGFDKYQNVQYAIFFC